MVHYLTRLLILGLFLSISSSADAFQVPTCLGPVRTSGFRAHQIRTMALDADGSQPDLHVAWVGNSFVYYNKLPRMLKCMFKSGGTALQQKEVLVGGQGLHGHSKDENVDKMLAGPAFASDLCDTAHERDKIRFSFVRLLSSLVPFRLHGAKGAHVLAH